MGFESSTRLVLIFKDLTLMEDKNKLSTANWLHEVQTLRQPDTRRAAADSQQILDIVVNICFSHLVFLSTDRMAHYVQA